MIKPSGFPHFGWEVSFNMGLLEMMEIDTWCQEVLGDHMDRWRKCNNGWHTRSYEDAVLIEITWS